MRKFLGCLERYPKIQTDSQSQNMLWWRQETKMVWNSCEERILDTCEEEEVKRTQDEICNGHFLSTGHTSSFLVLIMQTKAVLAASDPAWKKNYSFQWILLLRSHEMWKTKSKCRDSFVPSSTSRKCELTSKERCRLARKNNWRFETVDINFTGQPTQGRLLFNGWEGVKIYVTRSLYSLPCHYRFNCHWGKDKGFDYCLWLRLDSGWTQIYGPRNRMAE